MAINETIVTGRKFRKLIDESTKLWQRISIWSKASDVEFDDGKNAETKIGAINGVTDSLTSTSSNIAASAKAVKELNDKVTQLSSNLMADLSRLTAAGTWGGGYAVANGYAANAAIPAGSASYVLVYVSLSQFPENSTYISVTNLAELPAFTITNRGYPGVKIFKVIDITKDASVSARSGGDYGSASVTIRSLK